ncbi:MAG: PASTA domain-containing protein [Spirochaetaceae bacterium]|nr:PASTA domain-containing protein [Spirochaetaceae bacterium]
MKDEKAKKPGFFKVMQENLGYFFLFALSLAIIFIGITFACFFAFLQPEEEVLVPNVVGKDLTEALMILQSKELYPKLLLQFTGNPDDKGMVLAQSIEEGMISKAGRRIQLTVSQGAPLTEVEDFVGQSLLDVQLHIKSIFPDADSALVVLTDPTFSDSDRPLNTIIAQEPEARTKLTGKTELKLIVSKGSTQKNVSVPDFSQMTIEDLYKTMETTELLFDFSGADTEDAVQVGTVLSQKPVAAATVPAHSVTAVQIGLPKANSDGNRIAEDGYTRVGIYKKAITNYPFLLPVVVTAVTEEGETTEIAKFNHLGGNFSFPFAQPAGTALIFTIDGQEFDRITVR